MVLQRMLRVLLEQQPPNMLVQVAEEAVLVAVLALLAAPQVAEVGVALVV